MNRVNLGIEMARSVLRVGLLFWVCSSVEAGTTSEEYIKCLKTVHPKCEKEQHGKSEVKYLCILAETKFCEEVADSGLVEDQK